MSLLIFYKDGFGIRQPMKVDMPKQRDETNDYQAFVFFFVFFFFVFFVFFFFININPPNLESNKIKYLFWIVIHFLGFSRVIKIFQWIQSHAQCKLGNKTCIK